jgi:hypothetical protein
MGNDKSKKSLGHKESLKRFKTLKDVPAEKEAIVRVRTTDE